MHMQVIEGRYKQFVSEIHHLPAPVHILRQIGIYAFHQTVRLYHHIPVRNDFQFAGCGGMYDISSVDFHPSFF